jgi:hypothetical protein
MILLNLIEVFQYVFIAFIVTLIITNLLNKYLYPKLSPKKESIIRLYLNTLICLFVLSSVYYLLLKYIPKIPFAFPFLKKYIPSLNNENLRGTELGISFVFFHHLNKFKDLIEKLF